MLQLAIQDYEGRSQTIPLNDGEFSIGRDDSNSICLTEQNVSRRHARLVAKGGRVYIENVAATYGTRFNNLLLCERNEFTSDDVVQIGDYVLELVGGKGKPARRDTALVDEDAQGHGPPAGGPPVEGATAIVNLADIQAAIDQGPVDSSNIPAAEQPRLVVESDNLRGLELRVTRSPTVLGRVADSAELVIDHRSISKEHARLTRKPDGSWEVLDLGSANGIEVNGEPYSKSAIKSGDRLVLGHVSLRFLAAGAKTPELRKKKKSGVGRLVLILGALFVLAAGAGVGYLVIGDKAVTLPGSAASEEGVDKSGEVAQAAADNDTPVDSVKDTIAKIRQIREDGMLEVALQAAQQGQKRRPGDADLSLLVRQLEIDIAVSKSFDEADANLATDPKAVYEGLGEKIVQLSDDSPLQERAARLIGKAKQLTVTRHLDDADRALKRNNAQRANSFVSRARALDPNNKRAAGIAAKISQSRAERRQQVRRQRPAPSEPKAAPAPQAPAQRKPARAVVKQPQAKPAPAAPAPAAAKMSGKDYYKAGRKAVLGGDKKAAVNLFKQAVSNGYGRAHAKLASLYFELGNKALCGKHGKRYLDRYPDAGDAPQIEGLIEKCR